MIIALIQRESEMQEKARMKSKVERGFHYLSLFFSIRSWRSPKISSKGNIHSFCSSCFLKVNSGLKSY
jgi:hypothetical protein